MKYYYVVICIVFILSGSPGLYPVSGDIYFNNVELLLEDNTLMVIGGLLDRPLLVDVFASWCVPCTVQGKILVEGYSDLSKRYSMLSLSVSPESDNLSTIQQIKAELGANWTFAIDYDLQFSSKARPSVLPTLYLIDTEGLLLKKWEGQTSVEDILSFSSTKKIMIFPTTFVYVQMILIVSYGLKKAVERN